MAGRGIRLFTDEMVSPQLAHRLVSQFYDVTCCRDMGRSNKRISDPEQLQYAAIHRTWLATGHTHAGIIVSEQIDDVAELERRVKYHLDTTDPRIQDNNLIRLL